MLEEGLVCLNCEELDAYYETKIIKERKINRESRKVVERVKKEN
jgi:hypothetical protein